jgi:hypothetical protein
MKSDNGIVVASIVDSKIISREVHAQFTEPSMDYDFPDLLSHFEMSMSRSICLAFIIPYVLVVFE